MVGLYKNVVPHWLETLMGEKFFQQCAIHESARKNERNIFCLDCCSSFCPQCLSPHRFHRLLQIRRYVYQDVIRLDDLEKLIDCAHVQSYTTNSAKVVFLNERPQTRPFRLSGHICITCDRPLQDPYLFCSLSCKVKHLVSSDGGVNRYLRNCDFLPLYDMDDGQLTPESVLEIPNSSSGDSSAGGSSGDGHASISASGIDVVVRKKRTSLVGSSAPVVVLPPPSSAPVVVLPPPSSAPVVVLPPPSSSPVRSARCYESVNRRKGAPSRSPLY